VPAKSVFENARHLVTGGFFERAPEWKQFPATGEKILPPAIQSYRLCSKQQPGNEWDLGIGRAH
jgi:hypothetical protein